MGQRPFQVNLHCMSGSVWLPLLNGLENRRMLLCVGQQQCLCSSRRDVEHPNLRAGSRSYRRGADGGKSSAGEATLAWTPWLLVSAVVIVDLLEYGRRRAAEYY